MVFLGMGKRVAHKCQIFQLRACINEIITNSMTLKTIVLKNLGECFLFCRYSFRFGDWADYH